MKSQSTAQKSSKLLFFIIIYAFISVLFYEFVTSLYIFDAQGPGGLIPFYIFSIVFLIISIAYFIINHNKPDLGLFKAIPINSIYFISVAILCFFSLSKPNSLIFNILVLLLAFSGMSFIVFYLSQHEKNFNKSTQTKTTKKLLINICLILLCWIPSYTIVGLTNVGLDSGILLIILGSGYFFYQKRHKLILKNKFLGFLLIFIVVLSIIPVLNDRFFVRENIQYTETYNIENSFPNSFISTVETFNYTYDYNWSTYVPESNGDPNFIANVPSDRFWYRDQIDRLQNQLFIPYNNYKVQFQYNLTASTISTETPLNISYSYDNNYGDNTTKAEYADINVSNGSSEIYQNPYFSGNYGNFCQCFVFLNHSYFLNPTNAIQQKEINSGYIVKIQMHYFQRTLYSLIVTDWTQNQLVILDGSGNMMLVIISSTFISHVDYSTCGCGRNLDPIY